MENDSQSFGGLLRRLRQAANLTQEILAERADISPRALRSLERGEHTAPHPGTIERLAEALELIGEGRQVFILAARPTPPRSRPAPGSLPRYRPLPSERTSFVGRIEEVASLASRLQQPDVRLVTLTGPGGVGKTRIALQVARDPVVAGPGTVAFVSLASLRDPALIPPEIARAFALPESKQAPPIEAVVAHVGARDVLLLVDNCEHVLEGLHVVGDLLSACPRLRVLATSRVRLHLIGEHEMMVEPLAVPPAAAESSLAQLAAYPVVDLFAQRARAACWDFRIDEANAPAVAALCARLDGLPLAVELAAARSKTHSPQALLAALAAPGGPLTHLTDGPRDVETRQQTLRATLAWSYTLLDAVKQVLFRALSVFVAGCSAAAVAAVVGTLPEGEGRAGAEAKDIVVALDGLVDHSLLRVTTGPGGQPWYEMLTVIREYAMELAQEAEETARLAGHHAAYYVTFVEGIEEELRGKNQAVRFSQLEWEHDNLRAALRWARASGQSELGLRLAGALSRFWQGRGYFTEGRQWLEHFLTLPASEAALLPDGEGTDPGMPGPAVVRAKALSGAGNLAYRQGDYPRAAALQEESLALRRLVGDQKGVAACLDNLGLIARELGNDEQAAALHTESLALRRRLGDRQGLAVSLGNLGIVVREQGDYRRAAALYEESLALHKELGDDLAAANVLDSLGILAHLQGDHQRAVERHEESLTLRRSLGDKGGRVGGLVNLGKLALVQGDHRQAVMRYGEALVLADEVGDRRGIAYALEGVARAIADPDKPMEDVRLSVSLLAAAHALRRAIGAILPPVDRPAIDKVLEEARIRVGWENYTAAWERGKLMESRQAIDLALTYLPGATSASPAERADR